MALLLRIDCPLVWPLTYINCSAQWNTGLTCQLVLLMSYTEMNNWNHFNNIIIKLYLRFQKTTFPFIFALISSIWNWLKYTHMIHWYYYIELLILIYIWCCWLCQYLKGQHTLAYLLICLFSWLQLRIYLLSVFVKIWRAT